MQRAAEREQRDRRDQREQRVKGLHRFLVCAAAVPVMLIATGCSSDSGSDDGAGDGAKTSPSASASVSPSPTVQAAAYKALPQPCKVLAKKTLEDLVPKAKSGKEGSSDDASTRGSCSWSSLDNNGVKGSQFRWLNVSLLRFDSDVTRGSGDKLAQEYYETQVQDARSVSGAKNVKSEPVSGVGDEATAVRYDLKKKEGSFKQETVVARVENVVVMLDYNGAGLAGEKTPSSDTLNKLAQKAAKEAVAAVTKANTSGSGSAGTPSSTPSKSASKTPSKSPSASASKAASSSPSQSASKKS
ncbi:MULTISPECIES: DUF3558 family protein [unclassified Streptomyces]|uniref:DUF3558 family protein n=1 Tax=unclassified Streptomyces TaxID=2593676 RepID=UPI0023670D7D|nr:MULTISPECIES: DUF3558 family protein [unclassified Streptomyces]MDF3141962.1 DUF3558 family protein [Streptomyces sp. T21Q-yed]WDF40331.1 DUF3558 family protein [Streptomyces sp. T12]